MDSSLLNVFAILSLIAVLAQGARVRTTGTKGTKGRTGDCPLPEGYKTTICDYVKKHGSQTAAEGINGDQGTHCTEANLDKFCKVLDNKDKSVDQCHLDQEYKTEICDHVKDRGSQAAAEKINGEQEGTHCTDADLDKFCEVA